MQNLSRNQKIVLVVFVLMLVLLPFAVIAIRIASDPRSFANPAAQPTEVFISNITANSATVSYITTESVTGYANAVSANGTVRGSDDRDSRSGTSTLGTYKLHYIEITNLTASTAYEVTIVSDNSNFTGTPAWSFTTKPLANAIGAPSPFFGKLASGTAIPEGVVYAIAGNSSGNTGIASTYIDNNYTFTLDRNNFIDANGDTVDLAGKDILLFINGLAAGRGRVQFTASQNNAPDVSLSQATLTFTGQEVITPGSTPSSFHTTDPESNPTTDPGDYSLDTFSESLLTSKFSDGGEDTNSFAPYNVFISNLHPGGFTVNWLTKQPSTGYIEVSEDNISSKVIDPRDGTITSLKKRFTHSAEATDAAIPAGTVFEFTIVSNGIKFGSNIAAIAAEYNKQFTAHAATNKTALSFNPDLVDPTPFKVIIPGAPSSPPAVAVQEGVFAPEIAQDKYASVLSTIAGRSPDAGSNVDSVRDFLAAVKTSSGTWVSDVADSAGKFSLSIGSTLTTAKNAYIDVNSGDSLSLSAYGFANQTNSQTSISFAPETEVEVRLANSLSFNSILHGSVSKQPLLVGFAKPSGQIQFVLNGTSESVTVNADGSWQSRSAALKVGSNRLEISDSNSDPQEILFIVDISELPVTSLDSELVLIGVGILLLSLGFYVRYKFSSRIYK